MAGMRAWQAGDPAVAETKFREALVANSRYLAAHIALAQLLLDEGRAQESVSAFDEALSLRGTSVDALLGRAQALIALGRYEDAFASASTAIDLAADNEMRELEAAAQTASAQALTAMDNNAGAVAAYEAALLLDAGTTEARVGLARLYVELGDLPNAVRVLGRAASYEQDAEDLLAVGRAFHDFGVYDPAMDALEAAYSSDPSLDDVLYYYASSAVRSGRHDLGNSIATELIGRNPGYLEAYLARGEASLERGYIHNAREDAALVLARDPNNYDALVLDGDVEV
ncbi:MAG: tetratricopeptide (TPR) repeat protein, partial [Bradymonadia bacterium]